ncbi:FtsX-like permease family protein [Tepidiforma sp.]|uniref:FtsX-like permease family protein n=1 Tax=Tepidiforma sp. TaxID=2682230 RepID=UPI002ADD8F15|nr:FtsX-like permease family protein [Tepidiforma sp.]
MRAAVATGRLFARRSLSTWRLLAVLGLGILIAASLLAASPIYARTMADLGLTFTIREQLSESPGNRVSVPAVPLGSEAGQRLRDAIERRIVERIGWFSGGESRVLVGPRFFLAPPGETAPAQAPVGQLQSLTGYEAHVAVLEGELPRAPGPGEPLQVAVSRDAARAARLAVGQQLSLVEDIDTCAREIPREDRPPPPPCTPTAGVTFALPAVITAIIEPTDPADPFWVLPADQFFAPSRLLPENGPLVPLFVPEEALLDGLASRLPNYTAAAAWHTFARPEALTRTTFERARSDLTALYYDLEPLGAASFSPLGNVLAEYGRARQYQQAPLGILLLQLTAVAVFYVILVSLVIVERQAEEVALLRGRGATVSQVVAIYLVEGLLLGIPAVVVAPLLAAAGTALLGLTPTFRPVNNGDLLPVAIPPEAYLYAAAGVVISVAALLVPAAWAARASAVARRRELARPGTPFFQRYYLDLALAGVAGLLLWELRERGNVFTPSPTGGVSSDPLLLASPALLVAAAAALLLRFYPLALRLAARLAGRDASPALAVGLWQVARSPGNSARLALLLALAIAVGTFAASYATTASATFEERAQFQSGAEVRAVTTGSADLGQDGPAADAALRSIPGVASASAVLRLTGSPAAAALTGRTFQVLGLDPDAAPFQLWFRDDFAGQPLRDLLAGLGAPEPLRGRPLPPGAQELRVDVRLSAAGTQMTLWARIRDAAGYHQLIEFGTLEPGDWRTLSAPIARSYEGQLPEPLTLVGLIITEPANRFTTAPVELLLDNLAAVTADGTVALIDDFEAPEPGWTPLPARPALPDTYEVTRDGVPRGQAGKLSRVPGQGTELWGLAPAQPAIPLPVVATESFLGATGLSVGATGVIAVAGTPVPIRVLASAEHFPTLPAAAGPGVVFNRAHLASWLGLAGSSVPRGFNEAWLSLAPGADPATVEAALRADPFSFGVVTSRERELSLLQRNPLISAGGAGILYLAFGAILLLVAAALLVSLWLVVQRRRVEFAVLRSLGFSRGQVIRLLAFEYGLVAVVGIAAGAWIGRAVASRMLSFLDVDEAGRRAEPPFILQTDWLIVLGGSAAVVFVFLFAFAFASRLLARMSDAQALRTE